MSRPAIVLDQVSYRYPGGKRRAISRLSVSIREGEFVAVLGENGAGKSTFCQMLNGVIPTTRGGRMRGRVTVAGLDTQAEGVARLTRRWYWPLLIILGFAGAWYLVPLGREAWFQSAVWLLGIVACLIGWLVASNWIGSENRTKIFVGVFLAAIAGTIVDHAFGCLWALIQFRLPPEIWLATLPLAPVERTLFSLGAAIIGTPLLIGLPKIGLPVGQRTGDLDDDLDDDDLMPSARD